MVHVPHFPLVEVDWVDSSASTGWLYTNEMNLEDDLVPIRTIGRLMYQDTQKVVLAMSIDLGTQGHRQTNNRTTIPRVTIQRMVTLRCVRVVRPRAGARKK